MDKTQRVHELLRRLSAAPRASSFDEARAMIAGILNAVEDEMSGVPYNPASWKSDARLYPVQDDNLFDVEGHPGVTRMHTFGHEIYVASNGAIRIVTQPTFEIVFDKAGLDGVFIPAEVP